MQTAGRFQFSIAAIFGLMLLSAAALAITPVAIWPCAAWVIAPAGLLWFACQISQLRVTDDHYLRALQLIRLTLGVSVVQWLGVTGCLLGVHWAEAGQEPSFHQAWRLTFLTLAFVGVSSAIPALFVALSTLFIYPKFEDRAFLVLRLLTVLLLMMPVIAMVVIFR